MKIVSLQSVTNDSEFALNEIVYDKMLVKVGDEYFKNQRDGSFKSIKSIPKVTEIGFGDLYHGMEMPRQDDTYFVYTSECCQQTSILRNGANSYARD